MKNDLICTKHEKILDLCDEILDLDYDRAVKTKIKRLVNKIIKLTDEAKVDGQKMEDRLYEYYNGISEIGFKRKKKTK